jgi:hypothetical protein
MAAWEFVGRNAGYWGAVTWLLYDELVNAPLIQDRHYGPASGDVAPSPALRRAGMGVTVRPVRRLGGRATYL